MGHPKCVASNWWLLTADIAQAYLRQFYNYPVWAILIVTLSVFTIWALTAHGRNIAMA